MNTKRGFGAHKKTGPLTLFFFFFLFFHPIYYVRPSILSLLVVTQIRGHITGSSPPLPTAVRDLHTWYFVFARRFQLFLPSSTRVELCLPTLGPLSRYPFFFFLQINSKYRHGGIRTHGPTLVAFEGHHQSTGASGALSMYSV